MNRRWTKSCIALSGAHRRDEVILSSAVRSASYDPLSEGRRTCNTRRTYHHEASSMDGRGRLGMAITGLAEGAVSLAMSRHEIANRPCDDFTTIPDKPWEAGTAQA